MRPRVVVTGLGVVAPNGTGVEAFASAASRVRVSSVSASCGLT